MLKSVLALTVLTVLAAAAYQPLSRYWEEKHRPRYRTAEVTRRNITMVVNSTGEVKPVLSVAVGSFVSGPIEELHVEFNDRVTAGQLLAEIDPRIYDAAVARDRATLLTRQADVKRVKAQLQQAINDEKRATALRKESKDFISQAEIDGYHFTRVSLEAQVEVAEAGVAQAVANLSNSEANLAYTKIRSPVDGIVIDRKIDPGQTLAAQFQTPELFVIAPDMEKRMDIYASVDEADIGLIRAAQLDGQPVEFTVDAYPEDLFEGRIEQIRYSSTQTQNVVTYPVVVSAKNPELKLLPGMTAELSFTIKRTGDVMCVPNAALRYFPSDKKLVREQDLGLLKGKSDEDPDDEVENNATAGERIAASQDRDRRHVWVEDEGRLRAIEVVTGVYDNRYTEVVSGELDEGQELVVGRKEPD